MKAKGVFKPVSVMGGMMLGADDARAKEIMAALTEGKKVLAWVHTARFPDHHRFAMAVLRKIGDSIGQPVEVVLTFIKRETGRFDFVRMPDGTTEKSYHSIAFESMSQEEFQAWWSDAMLVIKEQLLPGASAVLFKELQEMLAGKVG